MCKIAYTTHCEWSYKDIPDHCKSTRHNHTHGFLNHNPQHETAYNVKLTTRRLRWNAKFIILL